MGWGFQQLLEVLDVTDLLQVDHRLEAAIAAVQSTGCGSQSSETPGLDSESLAPGVQVGLGMSLPDDWHSLPLEE